MLFFSIDPSLNLVLFEAFQFVSPRQFERQLKACKELPTFRQGMDGLILVDPETHISLGSPEDAARLRGVIEETHPSESPVRRVAWVLHQAEHRLVCTAATRLLALPVQTEAFGSLTDALHWLGLAAHEKSIEARRHYACRRSDAGSAPLPAEDSSGARLEEDVPSQILSEASETLPLEDALPLEGKAPPKEKAPPSSSLNSLKPEQLKA